MRVEPAEIQTVTPATEQNVYHSGNLQTVPGHNQLVKQDLVVVTCGTGASNTCAEKVRTLLGNRTRLTEIVRTTLLDSENDKVKTQSGKVLFLLSDRNQDGIVDRILSWIHTLKRNNHDRLQCFFVTEQQGQVDHQVLSIEYENENNFFVVPSFETIFQWWPQFLREMFGSSESHHHISLKTVELVSSNCSNNPLVKFVKQEFSVYEDNDSEMEDVNKIIVIYDGSIQNISQEMKQSLRDSKLNGADIYLYALESETFQGNAVVNKISTKHYTSQSEMEFLLDVLIDFGIVKNKLKLDSRSRPAKPAGILLINNLQENSVFLVWGQQHPETSAGTTIVIRQKVWYDGKWVVIEENLPGFVNGYEVKELDTLSKMYIFSVVRENESGVSDPLVSDECTLMPKGLDIVKVMQIIGFYILIGLVLFLNVSQSFIGLSFVVFLLSIAVAIYLSYLVLSMIYYCASTKTTEEYRESDNTLIITTWRPPTPSMPDEVACCIGGICGLACQLLEHTCFGNADKIEEYLFAYGSSITLLIIGLIVGLATNFNGILLGVFFIVLLFGVGWCIVFHFVLICKYDVEHGVYGLARALKDKIDDIHPYKLRQTKSPGLETIQVENI